MTDGTARSLRGVRPLTPSAVHDGLTGLSVRSVQSAPNGYERRDEGGMTDASYRNGAAVERRLWPWAWGLGQSEGFSTVPYLVFGALHRSRVCEKCYRAIGFIGFFGAFAIMTILRQRWRRWE